MKQLSLVLLLCGSTLYAQVPKESINIGIAGAVANSTSDYSVSLFHQIAFGQRRIVQFNYGLRSNGIFNKDVMKDVDNSSIELIQPKTTFISANNFYIGGNLNFLERFGVGFNMDVGGFSAGTVHDAYYDTHFSNDVMTYANKVRTKPSSFNLRKGITNNTGSLNSELYVECRFDSGIRLRGGVSQLVTELIASGGGLAGDKHVHSSLALFTINLSYPLWERADETVPPVVPKE